MTPPPPSHYQAIDARNLETVAPLSEAQRDEIRVVSQVLPFRTNRYVTERLIDWSRVPDDPIFRLVFPHRDMIEPEDYDRIAKLLQLGTPSESLRTAVHRIWQKLNPHPAGQTDLNVPVFEGRALAGVQHKYRETVLLFPAQGQTCHSYCTYCFRWPQFVGHGELKLACDDLPAFVRYLAAHREVTGVLLTGGDPLVMRTAVLARYVEALLVPELSHIGSIRIGSKAPATWPSRFVHDRDADDLLRLFERVVESGRTLALMAHYSHPRELETDLAQYAVRRIGRTGAIIRSQAPLVRHVNDDAAIWADMWRRQVPLGIVPYYMFVERDTGARRYFEVPLVRAQEVYRDAVASVSGLARTARGPSMSAMPGKICIDGTPSIRGERVFVLRFLQARDPAWVDRAFFARFDPRATWFDQLRPAFSEDEFFFEPRLREIVRERTAALTRAA